MFGRKKGAEGSVLQELCHFVIITPAYEVYRGYIVFAFSVYMFVCVCACVFVNFFLSKISRKLLDLGF